MKKLMNSPENEVLKRRTFLRYAGAGAVITALTVTGCNDEDKVPMPNEEGVYFGRGDIAVLNYAYALEQLEAAFYTKIIEAPYSGISDLEMQYLTDLRDHEIAHREFFKTAIGDSAITELELDFSSINFGSRDSVLATAKAFEDLGVSAYNGAGRLLEDVNFLALAGKIVSVEARHAALIRDLISNGSFADSSVIDANGLDTSRSPGEVLSIASMYITTPINVKDLPTY
jgi:hypothetical protein